MTIIDIENWKRKEHFHFFKSMDIPFYNVNFNVDITGLKDFAKSNGLSLNHTLIYLTIKAMNQIENFRYRLRGDTVVLHEQLNPSFTSLVMEDELFKFVTLDFDDDLFKFDAQAKKAVIETKSYFNFEALGNRDDFVFISSLPWISFTGIDHTISMNKSDAIPRVTWGKFFSNHEGTFLPFNIQVNHIFIDGFHLGQFHDKLLEELNHLINKN